MAALHTLIVYITITLYCSDNCKVNYGNIVFLGDSIGSTKIVMGLPKSQYTKNQFSLHHHLHQRWGLLQAGTNCGASSQQV